MRLWPFSRRSGCPSDDARCSLAEAHRALTDAEALGRAAEDLSRRAGEVADQFAETRRVNHVAEAVVESIRRRVSHP